MKELIGIVLFGLFGFAIWRTRQAATTAPRCPTIAELEAINRDIYEDRTDLADAENLAKSYDAIKGCEAAASSIRATVLAKKSTGVSSKTPDLMVSPEVTKKAVDVDTLLVAPEVTYTEAPPLYHEAVGPLSVDALSSPIRENVKYLLAKPRAEWTSSDSAMYGVLTGAGKPPSEGCGGLQPGQILLDWIDRKAFVCSPTSVAERNTIFADHPDNALTLLFARAGGG